jgi:hypothetical protein
LQEGRDEMDSETMTDIVTRLRHKAIMYREAAEKCVEAIRVLQGPLPGDGAKRIEAGPETETIVEEAKQELAVPDFPRCRSEVVPIRTRGKGLMAKIRTGVAKIGPATTGEITAWIHKHDFPATTSSTVSALLWEGRRRGEFSKDSEARWTYTGGLR